jgi:hypothetical protein
MNEEQYNPHLLLPNDSGEYTEFNFSQFTEKKITDIIYCPYTKTIAYNTSEDEYDGDWSLLVLDKSGKYYKFDFSPYTQHKIDNIYYDDFCEEIEGDTVRKRGFQRVMYKYAEKCYDMLELDNDGVYSLVEDYCLVD